MHPLDAAAGAELGDTLAARLQLLEDRVVDLEVPGVVVVAGLQDGAAGRGRVAATLQLDVIEEGLVGLAIVLVDRVGDRVAGL